MGLTCCESEDIKVESDSDACVWRFGGFGSDMVCEEDMILTGSCVSGKDPNCQGPQGGFNGNGIYCCPWSDVKPPRN